MSSFNPMFFLMYMSSFFLVLGSDSWFLLWGGLEINMISFIVLVYSKSMMKIEVCLKYFFIQGVGSAMLLLVLMMGGSFFMESMMLILSYKMGSGPFFFWFPSFCGGISWTSCVIVMSLQKLIPLFFMYLFICSLGWLILTMSMIIGVMGCLNESNLKKFFAFSSIHYVGWMILCLMCNSFLWLLYLVGYTIMLVGVLISISFNEMISLKDLLKMKSPGLFIFSMLNMGGLPPMLGFFLKWWVFLIVLTFQFELMWFILILAVWMFYVYARIVYSLMMDYNLMFMYSYSKLSGKQNLSVEWLYLIFMFISPVLGWMMFSF